MNKKDKSIPYKYLYHSDNSYIIKDFDLANLKEKKLFQVFPICPMSFQV